MLTTGSAAARLIAAIACAALLAGCADKLQVRVESDPLVDVARYRSYAWLTDPPEPVPGDLDPAHGMVGWRVRTTVDRQLAERGYVKVDRAGAELLVGVRSAVTEKNANTIGDYLRYREAGGSQSINSAFALGYEEATIAIELFDAASQRMVWRGVGLVAMDAHHRADRAAAVVVGMFADFPRSGGQ